MFLFKLWIFDFNLSSLVAFLVGILVGFIILLLLYAVMVISSLGSKNFIIKRDDDPLELSDVKDMVIASQEAYKNKELRGKKSRPSYCFSLIKDLVQGIAYCYAPKSKYPIFELTVEEAMLLTTYISKRVDELLDRKGVRLMKKFKVSQIMDMTKKTNSVMNNEIVQTTMKASKVKKVIDYVNIINPYKIFKIQVIDRIINVIVDKLCLVIIAVAGEETYKIYSKKAFEENNELSLMIDGLINDIDSEVNETEKEVKENLNEDDLKVISSIPNYKFKTYTNFKMHKFDDYKFNYNLDYKFKEKKEELYEEEKENID